MQPCKPVAAAVCTTGLSAAALRLKLVWQLNESQLWILLAAGVAVTAAALLVRWLLRRGVRRAKRAATVQRSLTRLHALGNSSSFQKGFACAVWPAASGQPVASWGVTAATHLTALLIYQLDGCGQLAQSVVELALDSWADAHACAAGAQGNGREAVAAAVAELLATAARVQQLMGREPAKQA